jgi:hypothetical protein
LDPQTSNQTTYATPLSGNDSKKKTKVLSTKITLEDYEAYKIFGDEMFDGTPQSISVRVLWILA